MSTSTTTNYGWTIPNDDELVKNGAAAIRTLGQAIDTTAAASFSAGLVHINTTAITAVSAVSLDDVFSADYDYYKIFITAQTASSTGTGFRLRASGTDVTTGYAENYTAQNSDNRHSVNGAATQFDLQFDASGGRRFLVIDLLNPYLAENTFFRASGWYDNVLNLNNGALQNVLQYDGFTYRPNSGNFVATGQIQVFGYKG